MSQAEQLKAQGNKAFASGDFATAEKFFSQAIEADPTNHVLYSNRSACFCSLKDYSKALEDANKTVSLKKDWAKGYSRKGAALFGSGSYEEAIDAYNEGLKIDPNNAQLKKGLEDARNAVDNSSGPIPGLEKLFGPDLIQKVAGNPKLSPYLADMDYINMLENIQQNPRSINQYMSDPRMMTTIVSLLNIQGGDDTDHPMADAPPSPPKKEKKPEPVKEEKVPEPVEESEEDKQKKEALRLKDEGNKHYKKREFEQALDFYAKAWEIDSTNISVLNNKAAVLFEMEKFDECIETCQQAVEVGREHRADYKLVARALGRIGNAYYKKDSLDDAIKYLEKSLTEHRTADVLNKLRECEKLKKQREKEAYFNPELSDKARDAGNEHFKKNEFALAVQQYTEAIKRNEKDPRAYSNRAACYSKLMALPEAMKDCEKCIELDPTFIKAYIRKANIQFTQREFAKCLDTLDQAREQDKEHKHATEIGQLYTKAQMGSMGYGDGAESQEEVMKRAREDPEVQAILADPAMNQILQQMQQDPKAIQDHMKNPKVASNIRKLMQAGIVRVG